LSVKAHLPSRVQDIFRKAFNGAWQNHGRS
jgi:cation transport regulator ChaB